ncbi:hypothetical protein ABZ488_33010 [Streptomyces griseus]
MTTSSAPELVSVPIRVVLPADGVSYDQSIGLGEGEGRRPRSRPGRRC